MNIGLRRVGPIVLLLGAVAVPSFGWGSGGHMAVAYVAYEKLTPQARDRVDALIKLNPKYDTWKASLPATASPAVQNEMLFMIAATWADQIKGDGHHVADGPNGGDRPPDDGTAGQNIGYSDTAMHKYWHFVDEPFSQDGTALQNPPTPNAETQIPVFRAALASDSADDLKSYDLVWLLHLAGDVHQPLHCASRFGQAQPNGDAGGNRVHVCTTTGKVTTGTSAKGKAKATAKAKASKAAPNCKGNLHAFWDDLFGTSPSPAPAMKIGKTLPAAPADPAADLDTAHWVKESFDDAVQKIYVNPPIGLGAGPFTLTPAYRKAALSLARERVALAGARLANILNKELK
jgi:hypothetical protein